MLSKIIGKIDFDQSRLKKDLTALFSFECKDQYSEYTFGQWSSHVLMNETGDKDDTLFRTYCGLPKVTSLGRQLPYLCETINHAFGENRVRWARVFLLSDGFLISHRDFVEFDKPLIRLNIPVHTDESCLHSEGDDVFHMREGEMWHLEANNVHAAVSLKQFNRALLILDFDEDGQPLEQLLQPSVALNSGAITPHIVERDAIDNMFLASLYALGEVISKNNFKDIIRLLGKIHFTKKANAAACYDWLIEIAKRSGDDDILHKAVDFRRYCIENRHVGERFKFEL